MSKQQEAPGELEHVRAFVNTVDLEEGADELTRPDQLSGWLVQSGMAPAGLVATTDDLEHAIGLREALRAVLLAHNADGFVHADAASELDRAAARARLRLRFDKTGSGTLEPAADGVDGALGRLLAIVHRSAAEGTWARLKACRDETCEWAF
ncbi:MAG TPA: ABATE domain-containing protein, partial [Solirubrobacteraceae bacterium]|nr:ABATE domain-containing protein [Solirubrobacteraceae bacterium]